VIWVVLAGLIYLALVVAGIRHGDSLDPAMDALDWTGFEPEERPGE